MENKSDSREEVLEKIKQNIALSEEKREKQRLAHNLAAFAHGNTQILVNDEMTRGLVTYLLSKSNEDLDAKKKILTNLGEAVTAEDRKVRERALTVLSLAGENYLQCSQNTGILLVAHSFCRWLEHEKEIVPGLEVIIKRIEELALWILDKSYWQEGAQIVSLFCHIRNGKIGKNAVIRGLVSQTLDKFADERILKNLTDGFLLGDNRQALFQNFLLFFEEKAARYLFDRVIASFDRNERLTLINLIPNFGLVVLPVLEKSLENKPIWSVVRNALYILSEIGNDSCYIFIKQYFQHEDKRVQYEMIGCVVKLGGPELKNRLLTGLKLVTNELKVLVIQLLVEHAPRDEAVLGGLSEFVGNGTVFLSSSGMGLVGATIAALKTFPSIKSIEILQTLQDCCRKMQDNEIVQLQIDEALKSLAPQVRHRQQRFTETPETVSFDSDPQQMQKALKRMADIEKHLRKFLQNGDMNGAGEFLYEQAFAAALAKQFFLAEKLRDRLLEINPMALDQAVALGDLIEEEKTSSHTRHHLGVWGELYEEMTTEEFNALYSSLRQEEYRKNEMIVQMGETDDVLYFLNSGYVSLNCYSGGKENFLKRMGPSSILGGEQFFSASVWTVTLRTLSDVHLQVLDHAVFRKIIGKFPEIEGKLWRFCRKYEDVPALLKMSGDDRREYPRFCLTLFTQNVLFDAYGKKGKRSFRGELIDISRNGLAFIIKISSRKNAKLMLGRQIISEIQFAQGEPPAECSGVIVGVRYNDQDANAFSVHVKLSKKIQDSAFTKIMALRRP